MNTVFDFEQYDPPVLNEKILREEKKRRELKRQIIFLFLAALLFYLCGVLFALFMAGDSLLLAVLCLLFLCVSLIGNGIISIIFFTKRRIAP